MNYYTDVFIEALWTASIIPLSQDATFTAMKLFGGYDMTTAAVIAVAGASLGQLFNWWVGRYLYQVRDKANFKLSEHWYNKISHIFNKYLVFLLLFSWAPIGGILLGIAGFTKTPLKMVMPLVIIGYCYYYFSVIL